jgi:hypothetical protein
MWDSVFIIRSVCFKKLLSQNKYFIIFIAERLGWVIESKTCFCGKLLVVSQPGLLSC